MHESAEQAGTYIMNHRCQQILLFLFVLLYIII